MTVEAQLSITRSALHYNKVKLIQYLQAEFYHNLLLLKVSHQAKLIDLLYSQEMSLASVRNLNLLLFWQLKYQISQFHFLMLIK
jgi:hypothetical protein